MSEVPPGGSPVDARDPPEREADTAAVPAALLAEEETTVEAEPVPAPQPGSPLATAAICHRCGGGKRGPFVPCKSCGFTPGGIERQVAWLFSEHHLGGEELAEAARRIRSGERPEPPRSLLEQARIRMGAAPLTTEARRPLSHGQLVAMIAANILLTPLVGLALWWGLKPDRPVAARQALRLTVPVVVAAGVAWAVLVGRWTLG